MCVCVHFQAHAELQESMAVNHQQTLGGLQEASAKMMSQQAEAARYTADAARHIKEVSRHRVALLLSCCTVLLVDSI